MNIPDLIRCATEELKADNDRNAITAEDAAWARKVAARKVLRDAYRDDNDLTNLEDSPFAGDIAADLWSTWAPNNRTEPLVEVNTDAICELIFKALRAPSAAARFETECELGMLVAGFAQDYILRCHSEDAEDVLDDLRAEERAKRDERAWREEE